MEEIIRFVMLARKLRMEYAGAIYHVMNRGDRHEPIFRDDQDRHLFLETLGHPRCTGKDREQVNRFYEPLIYAYQR